MTNMAGTSGPVLLFPGQGGFDGVALRRAAQLYPQVDDVFEEIDEAVTESYGRRVSDLLCGVEPAELASLLKDEPWISQLAVFGSGLAAHRVLVDHGVRPVALTGHSLGEITALVAAGAYSVADGARIVMRRTDAVAKGGVPGGGSMVALSVSPVRAGHLVGLVADPLLAVAAENHDTQTVLSGPHAAVEHVKAITDRLRIGTADIDAPFAFHNPALGNAAPGFTSFVRDRAQLRLTVPVYSPILRRYYEEADDLAELLTEHLTRPVMFADAIREFHARGARTFVETGGRAALSSLVSKILRGRQAGGGDTDVTLLSTLHVGREDTLALAEALAALGSTEPALADDMVVLRRRFAPHLSEAEFSSFWAADSQEITTFVRRRAAAFQNDHESSGRLRPDPSSGPVPTALVTAQQEAAGVSDDGPGREALFATVRSLYAEALEYPEDVFTADALLEAELGVDSVKQVELLSRVSRRYELPERSSNFRLADYETLGRVVDLIESELRRQRSAAHEPGAVAA